MTPSLRPLLLAATMLAGAAPAHAEDAATLATELATLRAEVATLRARVGELEGARTAASFTPQQPASSPAPAGTPAEPESRVRFSGAPRITAPGGWSFKPRGRLQFDAGYVSSPNGIADPGLGFSNELRRARLGVEGSIPGGFGYVFELDFADGVEIADAILTYRASDAVGLTIGQHNGFQSLEELTSSRFTSFVERAAFTDAFNFERRVGLSGSVATGALLVQAGVFTDNVEDLGDDGNNSAGIDGRIVFAPELGDTQLHLGASAHWRDNGDLPMLGATTRYRQRPLIHSTDVRFIGTPALAVAEEMHYGLEAAVIHGPFHAAGEAHWLQADTMTPGLSPTFFGGYAEVGYFLTGESRGYRGGKFDRTRVARPIEEGGLGAFQVNLRYDRLDLNSGPIRGGTQDGLMASLIWIPTDYVRFLLNYARLNYDDAAIPAAGGDRSYAVDVIGARAQIDF
jgi:phosphate-selective porin OprO and OprP